MKTREPVEFRRGDILWIQCDPSVGVEPRKTGTYVVVSNDVANRYGQAVTVVPTATTAAVSSPMPWVAACSERRRHKARSTYPVDSAWPDMLWWAVTGEPGDASARLPEDPC